MNSARALALRMPRPEIAAPYIGAAIGEHKYGREDGVAYLTGFTGPALDMSGFGDAILGLTAGALAGPVIALTAATPPLLTPAAAAFLGYGMTNWLALGDGSTIDTAVFTLGAALAAGGVTSLGVSLARLLFGFGPLTFWPAIGWTTAGWAGFVAVNALWPQPQGNPPTATSTPGG